MVAKTCAHHCTRSQVARSPLEVGNKLIVSDFPMFVVFPWIKYDMVWSKALLELFELSFKVDSPDNKALLPSIF